MSATARRSSPPRSVVPEQFIRRIVETLRVEEIWLFGSRARGTASPNSDWDLLAVVRDDSPSADLDLARVWSRLRDLRVKRVDVFPVRRSDFEAARDALGTLSQIATDEGYRVYGEARR
jgi:predicted nucleotidyltransferase